MATLKVEKSKWGGARPGGGRKPSELTEAFRQYFTPHFDDLLACLLDLALGHQAVGRDGKVYAIPPDRATLTYVLDRLLGKPKQEGEPVDLGELLKELRGDGHSDRS